MLVSPRLEAGGENFDRDAAMQLGILRFVNDAHPAAGQLALDAIARGAEVRLLSNRA